MDLFPKSNADIFRRRAVVAASEPDLLEVPSTKMRLEQWQSISRHIVNNDKALEREMDQTMCQVNDFLRRLEITTRVRRHLSNRPAPDQLMLAQTLKAKVKELLELEDIGVRLSKSFRSNSHKPSDIGVNAIGIQDNEDSVSQCSRYSDEIKDILRRFNFILRNNGLVDDIGCLEEPLRRSRRDSLQFLTERFAVDKIQPTFKLHPLKPTDSLFTVTCAVFSIAVNGTAPEKMAAKKAAAVTMLERLLDGNLPSQMTPWTDQELHEAEAVLCGEVEYDTVLAEVCEQKRRPLPQYLPRGLDVVCSALGLEGVGGHADAVVARRAAARQILLQLRQSPRY